MGMVDRSGPSSLGRDLDAEDGAAAGRARHLEPALEIGDSASHRSQTEVFAAYRGWIEAAAVVGHLDRDGVVLCRDADRGVARPSVLDHVGQGFLAEAVQLL